MRLDQYLVHHMGVKTRSKAIDLIKRGFVIIDGRPAKKGGLDIVNQDVKIIDHISFVGRAGEKLYHAIDRFNLDFKDKICIDIGASTGGFTDCALKSGAKTVYTYDVGSNQLDEKLKNNPQVIVHEQTNILDVEIPDSDMILIDVSFISILKVFSHLNGYHKEIIALIKPQFEVGKKMIKQGVVKDIKLHKKILEDVLKQIKQMGFHIIDLDKSEVKGKKGNQEYILYVNGGIKPDKYITDLIEEIL